MGPAVRQGGGPAVALLSLARYHPLDFPLDLCSRHDRLEGPAIVADGLPRELGQVRTRAIRPPLRLPAQDVQLGLGVSLLVDRLDKSLQVLEVRAFVHDRGLERVAREPFSNHHRCFENGHGFGGRLCRDQFEARYGRRPGDGVVTLPGIAGLYGDAIVHPAVAVGGRGVLEDIRCIAAVQDCLAVIFERLAQRLLGTQVLAGGIREAHRIARGSRSGGCPACHCDDRRSGTSRKSPGSTARACSPCRRPCSLDRRGRAPGRRTSSARCRRAPLPPRRRARSPDR